MTEWLKENEQVKAVLASGKQVFVRSCGFYGVGAVGGVLLALSRSANVSHYALHVGTNCFLVAVACFTPREFIAHAPGPIGKLPDSVASTASGAIGGFAAMRIFSGTTRQGVKGALAFGLCGFVLEKANTQFLAWKLAKREELIAEQQRTWQPSAWQERQAGKEQ